MHGGREGRVGPVFLIQDPGIRKDGQHITRAAIVSRGKPKDSEAGAGLMTVKKEHGEL